MPGELLLNLPREKYDDTPRQNWSRLKLLNKSPAHFKANPPHESRSMTLGNFGHIATLEPERFAREVVAWGRLEEEKVRRGKVWDAFQAKHHDKLIATADEYDTAKVMAEAIHANPDAHRLLSGGFAEPTLLWECDGVLLKSRLDCLNLTEGAISDVKCCKDASPRGFQTDAARYDYFGQAAFYSGAVECVTGRALPFFFLAVENKWPHVTQVYNVPDEVIQAERVKYRALLAQLKFCEAMGEWPAYSTQILDLLPPPWALRPVDADEDESEDEAA